jgi:AraC-like DNA-binding protein
MTALELVIRTAACTSALVLAVAALRAANASGASRAFGSFLCVGTAIYTACSGSPPVGSLWLVVPAALLSGGTPFFFWGWTRSIMDDDFYLPMWALLAGLLLMVITVFVPTAADATSRGRFIALHSLLGLAFIVTALGDVLRGWRTDLIETRRRLRLLVLVTVGGYSMAVLTVELFLHGQTPTAGLKLVSAVLLATLLFGLACTMLGASPAVSAALGWSPPVHPVPARPADVVVSDPEGVLVGKLAHFMSIEAVYRDPQLAVATLAGRLGVSEKKLREVINERLGHKNFPSFVNAYRLEEVRQRLTDPRHDHLPILTLALDAGFGSVVAFNRAFKGKYGATPSEYRAQRGVSANSDPIPASPADAR